MESGSGVVTTFEGFVDERGKRLSPQLRRVFALLALTCDDDTIGLVLHLSHSTVRHYIDRVLSSLQVRCREDVALLYISSVSPNLGADLGLLFDPSACGRLSKILAKRACIAPHER
jgi:hypothetical protein